MNTTFIAHRGLWNDIYPENSLGAFENAVKESIAIELDIQLKKDNKLIVFHDSNLYRLTGINKKIKNISLQEIKKLFLNNTKYQVPTLEEVLNLVQGKVLLDIEIKHYNKSFKTVKMAKKMLMNYNGKYIIKSFNPLISWRYKASMKNISCGVLAGGYPSTIPKFLVNYLKYMKYLWFYKPDFICFNVKDIDDKVMKKIKKYNIPLYLYVIRDENTLKKAFKLSKVIVFEHLDVNKLK